MSDEAPVKRWTAKRKSAAVIDIFKGKACQPYEVGVKASFAVTAHKGLFVGVRSSPDNSMAAIRSLSNLSRRRSSPLR